MPSSRSVYEEIRPRLAGIVQQLERVATYLPVMPVEAYDEIEAVLVELDSAIRTEIERVRRALEALQPKPKRRAAP